MKAIVVQGRVRLVEESYEPAPGECAHVVEVDEGVRDGWTWTPEGCNAPEEPAPDPAEVAQSYLLADAQTVEDLREALTV